MNDPKTYQPSEEVVQTIRKSKILLIAGPSGSGKNTLLSELLKTGKYRDVITATTRPPRENHGKKEVTGEHYHFVSFDQFEKFIEEKSLVEYAVVFEDNYYGTPVGEFIKSSNEGKISVLDIDIAGLAAFLKINPKVNIVFLIPPSFKELLKRINKRHQDMVDKDKLEKRLRAAIKELKYAISTPGCYLVINHQIEDTIKEVNDYLLGKKNDQVKPKKLAEQIIAEITYYLS